MPFKFKISAKKSLQKIVANSAFFVTLGPLQKNNAPICGAFALAEDIAR